MTRVPSSTTSLGPDQAARVLDILDQWTARGWWYECRAVAAGIRIDYQHPMQNRGLGSHHCLGQNHFDALCQATTAMQLLLEEHQT